MATDSGKKRVLWLHTQPEHYHNCMMDDLQGSGEFDFVAAFSHQGSGSYTEMPAPRIAPVVMLQQSPAKSETRRGFWKSEHVDWRRDLAQVRYDAAIISGYGIRAHRELLQDCHRRGIPVAVFSDSNIRAEFQGGFRQALKRCCKKIFLRRIIQRADMLLAANRLGVAYWEYYGAASDQLAVCPYYADYARVAAAGKVDRAAVLARVGMKADEKLLFTAARLVPAKGLDLSIRAFRDSGLAEQGYRYLIAGSGPLEGELKRAAGEAEGKSIRFIGFQQPSDNLSLMCQAELFVLPSIYEPHGIVVQESMAAGTPVVASDVVGAAYDLVDAGTNGQIFRSGNAADLREKLSAMLSDGARLAAMRSAAREKFESWFAAYSPIQVVNAVVRRLLAEHGGEAR